uniref:Uncharacterized protein n=1 Tax=Opuntia streptacantha TaxID=393608 RepID=A0A7C9EBT6_OPUST
MNNYRLLWHAYSRIQVTSGYWSLKLKYLFHVSSTKSSKENIGRFENQNGKRWVMFFVFITCKLYLWSISGGRISILDTNYQRIKLQIPERKLCQCNAASFKL